MVARLRLILPFALALAACQAPPPPTSAVVVGETQVNATVESIDQATREVLLRGPEGRLITVRVGPAAQNLAQMRAGDRVSVHYREAVAAQISRAPPGSPPVVAAERLATAAPGQRPGGESEGMVRVRVRIDAVDPGTNTVTFTGPNAVTRVVKVRDPSMQAFARTLRPGDLVDLTYAEALAISVEPARS